MAPCPLGAQLVALVPEGADVRVGARSEEREVGRVGDAGGGLGRCQKGVVMKKGRRGTRTTGHQLHGSAARRQLPQSWMRQQARRRASESELFCPWGAGAMFPESEDGMHFVVEVGGFGGGGAGTRPKLYYSNSFNLQQKFNLDSLS